METKINKDIFYYLEELKKCISEKDFSDIDYLIRKFLDSIPKYDEK